MTPRASGMRVLGARLALGRVLGHRAAWLAAAIASGAVALAFVAGIVRVLPALDAPARLLDVGVPLARAAASVALEVGLFVAAPLGWGIAAAVAVDRGEARAMAALGVRPVGLAAASWPGLAVVGLACAAAALSWGEDAASPGRVATRLLEAARSACVADRGPIAAPVPGLPLAAARLPSAPPVVAGATSSPFHRMVFTSASLGLDDDLRSARAGGVTVLLETYGADAGSLRVRVDRATFRGLPILGRPSNLHPRLRALVLGATAPLLAVAAAALVLAAGLRERAGGGAVGASAAAGALVAFSTLEAAPSAPALYACVPMAGIASCALATAVVCFVRGRARVARTGRGW